MKTWRKPTAYHKATKRPKCRRQVHQAIFVLWLIISISGTNHHADGQVRLSPTCPPQEHENVSINDGIFAASKSFAKALKPDLQNPSFQPKYIHITNAEAIDFLYSNTRLGRVKCFQTPLPPLPLHHPHHPHRHRLLPGTFSVRCACLQSYLKLLCTSPCSLFRCPSLSKF